MHAAMRAWREAEFGPFCSHSQPALGQPQRFVSEAISLCACLDASVVPKENRRAKLHICVFLPRFDVRVILSNENGHEEFRFWSAFGTIASVRGCRIKKLKETLVKRISLTVCTIVAVSALPIDLARAAGKKIMYQSGIASVYGVKGGKHAYSKTANGERVLPHELTAAHRRLPFGTRVRVTNRKNGRSVIVRINDRGPFVGGRVIDLTPAGARALHFSGLAPVMLNVIE